MSRLRTLQTLTINRLKHARETQLYRTGVVRPVFRFAFGILSVWLCVCGCVYVYLDVLFRRWGRHTATTPYREMEKRATTNKIRYHVRILLFFFYYYYFVVVLFSLAESYVHIFFFWGSCTGGMEWIWLCNSFDVELYQTNVELCIQIRFEDTQKPSPGQARQVQGSPGQSRTVHARPGQSRTVQARAVQNSPGQSRAVQASPFTAPLHTTPEPYPYPEPGHIPPPLIHLAVRGRNGTERANAWTTQKTQKTLAMLLLYLAGAGLLLFWRWFVGMAGGRRAAFDEKKQRASEEKRQQQQHRNFGFVVSFRYVSFLWVAGARGKFI